MEEELRLGEEAANCGDLKRAKLHCRKALALDNGSYEAHLLAGRIAHYQGDYATAEAEYRLGAQLQPQELAAVEGLASVQLGVNNLHSAEASYKQLLQLARAQSNVAKQREFLWRLAETQDRLGELDAAEAKLKELLSLQLDSEAQRLQALCFLADMQAKQESSWQNERLNKYVSQQQSGTEGVKRSMSMLRLQVDAERADEQLAEGQSLAQTLAEIVRATLPCPRYARYHEMHLQIYLSRMGNFPPRSAARQQARMEAMRECVRMITTSAGGCCTPFPFEAAIWMLEEQEELYGGAAPVRSGEVARLKLDRSDSRGSFAVQTQLKWYRGNSIHRMSLDKLNIRRLVQEPHVNGETDLEDGRPIVTKHESFGVKLVHQFPWLGSASVAIGLALRRRFLSEPDAPSTALRRRQICLALSNGVEAGADSAAGWKALAELQYQNRQWLAAYQTCCKGLEWSARRRRAGHETLSGFALALRLCAARSLRRLGRLEEAEYAFRVLAGWTTEGECGFDELSGSPPTSVRQQALRGLAKIALQRGERDMAKAQYERILGKALLGRGQPAEHWAHAEYAWLQYEDQDLHTARTHLEKALAVAEKEGCSVTDSEIADHHYRLGRVLWDMGGSAKTDLRQARAHFEAASLEDNDCQEQACLWLGHWYREVARDLQKARNCYSEALQLDPSDSAAAQALAAVNEQLNQQQRPPVPLQIQPSAFTAQSKHAFLQELSQGQAENAASVSVPGSKASSGRLSSGRLALQTAHSANTELAGYWTVSKKQ